MKFPAYFIAKNSYYKKYQGGERFYSGHERTMLRYDYFDCYDAERNALTSTNKLPAVYHPPCRSWSRMRGLAKRVPVEHWLGIWSIIKVREFGGILEHPASSLLFRKYLIAPGAGYDKFGGFSICVDLSWFGFPAQKRTYLYIVGCQKSYLPAYPISFNAITHVVSSSVKKSGKKELSKVMRDRSPKMFVKWVHEVLTVINDSKSKI